ncbi:MAG: PhzF family phenazine biosynthesis protein [Candidatus Baltobacteraceae bacterium]
MPEYLLFDVFAERPFEGNPLAVFAHADGLETATMQRIANELNLSESVFLTRTGDEDRPARVRIFTPATEMAFAGHPTIGATIAIAEELRWTAKDAFVLEEGVGDVRVRVTRGPQTTAWLQTPAIRFGEVFAREDAAAVLQLPLERIRADAPVQLAGAGNPFLYVPLVDEAAVDAAGMDAAAVRRFGGDAGDLNGVFLFAQTAQGTYSRMFAPMSGIAEDPATGSAHGPLYAYLIEHELLPNASASYTALQGVKMRRRSVMLIRVHAGSPPRVDVGGSALLVGSGKLHGLRSAHADHA